MSRAAQAPVHDGERDRRGRGGRRLPGRPAAERAEPASPRPRRSLRLPQPALPAPAAAGRTSTSDPGLSSFITPNSAFYRVDTAIVLPQIPPSSWQLRIHGMVSRELTLSFDDLIKRPLIEDYITLTCVSNPVGRALHRQRPLAGRQPGLRSCARPASRPAPTSCTARRSTASPAARRSRPPWTAGTRCSPSAMNGKPLPVAHGFPVRTRGARALRLRVGLQVDHRHRGDHLRVERRLLGAARLVRSRRRSRPSLGSTCRPGQSPVKAGPDHDRRRRLGAAQGHRRGRGTRRRGPLAASQARRCPRHRHLAAVDRSTGTPRPATTPSRHAPPTRPATPRPR